MVWQRLIRASAVLVIVTLMTSLLLGLVPGSPAYVLAGETATPETIASINEAYGFDRSFIVQYGEWAGRFLAGDWGESYRTNESVLELIKVRAPITLQLALGAVMLALLVAIPLGLACAYWAGSPLDRAVDALTSATIAIPSFLIALGIAYFLSIRMGWLPVTGWTPFSEDSIQNVKHALIPTVALALPAAAVFQRVLRADVIASLQQDYITLARAKGLSNAAIVVRHAFRPSAFSLLTVVGIRTAEMVGGTVIIETLFAIPGLGSLLVQSVVSQDLIVVQSLVLLIAVVYLFINLAVDVTYRLLDPRVAS